MTKAEKEKFLQSCDLVRGIMPKEVIQRQQTFFDDVIITGHFFILFVIQNKKKYKII